MEKIHNRPLEILLGLLLAAALVMGVVVIWLSFRGVFSDKITVSAQLAKAGDALEQGDIVTYRNVIIGEVSGATATAVTLAGICAAACGSILSLATAPPAESPVELLTSPMITLR